MTWTVKGDNQLCAPLKQNGHSKSIVYQQICTFLSSLLCSDVGEHIFRSNLEEKNFYQVLEKVQTSIPA